MTNLERAVLHPHMAGLANRNQVTQVVGFSTRCKFSVWNNVMNAELLAYAAFGLSATLTCVAVAGSRPASLLLPRWAAPVRPLSPLVVPVSFGIVPVVVFEAFRNFVASFDRAGFSRPWSIVFLVAVLVATFARARDSVLGIAWLGAEWAATSDTLLYRASGAALPRTEASLAAGLINRELFRTSLANYSHLLFFALMGAGSRAIGLIRLIRPRVKRRATLLTESLNSGSLYLSHALIITRLVGGW